MTQKPLREAAQQLIDALMKFEPEGWEPWEHNGLEIGEPIDRAIDAIRAALALPDDPVGDNDAMQAAWLALRPEVGTAGWSTSDSCTYHGFFSHGWRARKQYAAPQPAEPKAATVERQPLTDDQLLELIPDNTTLIHLSEAFLKFARAIEAAHSIK